MYVVQEAKIVNDVAQSMSHIYAIVDNRQTNHQTSIIEIESMINTQSILILIDPSSKFSYVNPQVTKKCTLPRTMHKKSWLVQLVTRTKKSVENVAQ